MFADGVYESLHILFEVTDEFLELCDTK